MFLFKDKSIRDEPVHVVQPKIEEACFEKQKYIEIINKPFTESDSSISKRYDRIPKRFLDQEICELLIRRGHHPRNFDEQICIKHDLYNYAVKFYPPNILLIKPIYINDKMVELYRNFKIMNEPPGRYDHLLPERFNL